MDCVGGRCQTHTGRPAIEAQDAKPRVRRARSMTEILTSLLINALLRKGFEKVETHHTMLWFVVQGRRTSIHTWVSHGQRKLDDRLLRLIGRELHLSRAELLKFVECEMNYEDYRRRMVDEGYLRA